MVRQSIPKLLLHSVNFIRKKEAIGAVPNILYSTRSMAGHL
jgi:hypothetical protein